MQRKHLTIGLLVFALALGAAGLLWLRAHAFDLTGEEDLTSQIGGLAQLALNVVYRRPETQPFAAIEHTGVNPFGINTFLHQEVEVSKREEQVRLIAEAGFHWIRQEFPWEDIEIHGRGDFVDRRNDPEGIDAWAKYDNIVDLAEQYDLEIIARLSNPPAWSRAAGDEPGTYAPPDNFDDFANFAAVVARRYRGRIRYYQIWNEPNIYPEWGEQPVDPEAYTELLCAAYRAIKAVDPEAVILSGALAPTAELSGRDLNDYIFLQRMYDAGAGECFDILSMQGYGLWSGPTDRRLRPLIVNYGRNRLIRDIMVQNGDAHKAIWISEMNWNVAPEDVEPRYGRVTLDQQARWAPLAYERAQREWPWVGVINFWYFKRASDDWLAERRPEAYFQMAAPDFTLMPVYETMQGYATRPPVMYPGNHWADDWTVTYGEGWRPWLHEGDRARIASEGAGPVTFTFEGTSLKIVFGAHENPNYGLVYRVDGGPPLTLDQCCLQETIWRGRRGRHTVEIEPVGKVVITHFVVRDDPRVTPGALLAGAVLLTGAWYAARRRYLSENEARDGGDG
ncbi:MAG TPA: hypothetical protein ENI95_03040 [Chloroflexi bacterium]|nr:hypothetical protein [Chloroflexota bacterium]